MSKPNHNTGKRDANEQSILNLLNARNVRWTQLRPGDGADLLIWIHPMEVWEIKNPAQPPSKRRLTDDEKDAMAYCLATRIPYVVIEDIETAAHRLNTYFDRL